MRRFRLLLPASALGAIAIFAACSGDAQTGDDSIKSAHVELALFKANGTKAGSCSGVLVSPTRVLTAAHCVQGFTSWRVHSPGAQVAVTSRKAFTYDWQTTTKSQPRLHDVAVVMLDEPITLREYPTIASRGLDSTPAVRMRLADGEFESVTTTATSAKTLGFEHHYALKLDKGEALVTGGALMTPDGRMVLGIIHGQGATSGTLYATRVDSTANWFSDRLKCTNRMNPVTAQVACYKSDAGICLEHGPDCPNSRRDAGAARGDGGGMTFVGDDAGSNTGSNGGTNGGSTGGSGDTNGGSGSGGASGSGSTGGTGTSGATPGSCDDQTLLPNGTPLGSSGAGGSAFGAPGTTGSGGSGATGSGSGGATGTGSGDTSGSGGTGTGGSSYGSPGTTGDGSGGASGSSGSGGYGGSGSGSGSGGGFGSGTASFGFPGIGPNGAFKAFCYGAGCGKLLGATPVSNSDAINPGVNAGGGAGGFGGGSGVGGSGAGGSASGSPGLPSGGGFGFGGGIGGSGGFGSGSGFGSGYGLPVGTGMGDGTGTGSGSGSGSGGASSGSATGVSAGTGSGGGTGAGTAGDGSGTSGGTGAGGSATGSAGTSDTSGTGTGGTSSDGITREGPGCYGIASCVDNIVNYGSCCSDPGIGGTGASAPAPIK